MTAREIQLEIVKAYLTDLDEYQKLLDYHKLLFHPDRFRAMVKHVSSGTFIETQDIRHQWKTKLSRQDR